MLLKTRQKIQYTVQLNQIKVRLQNIMCKKVFVYLFAEKTKKKLHHKHTFLFEKKNKIKCFVTIL